MDRFRIRDSCRENLNKYILKAFSEIPEIGFQNIIDIGCGTGVSIMALAEVSNGNFYAMDSDDLALKWLRKKIENENYKQRIKIINASIYDNFNFDFQFDIIISEGLLNIVGFEFGLSYFLKLLKNNGYIIIHDEFKDDFKKKEIFSKSELILLNYFELNENIWWNEYYFPLENEIQKHNQKDIFKNEINEISSFKKNPELFKSVFYVLKHVKN